MEYSLGKYIYRNLRVYRKWFDGLLEIPIDFKTYLPYRGKVKIDELNGIKEEVFDTSKLTKINVNDLHFKNGMYLVNFVEKNEPHPNHPLPAYVFKKENDRLDIKWGNGHSCIIYPRYVNIWKL